MKVALCHHYSLTFHGGGERFLIDLAKRLANRGHSVAIYALPFGRRTINMKKWLQGIEYHEGFLHNIGDADVAYFIYAPILHRFLIGKCPKIAGIHAFVFALKLQHHEITSMTSTEFIRKFGWSRFASYFYFNKIKRNSLSRFDAVHAINREAAKLIRNQRVYYIPNWIDITQFKPTEEKNERFSALFVGRKAKGFSTFVKVAELLKNYDIDFLAAGPDVENVQNVKSVGLVTDVKELIKLYSKVHVLTYVSKVDVFPLSLLEACACGVPVAAIPTKAVEGLDLPLFYETTTEGFAKRIRSLQSMWQVAREDYMELVWKARAGVTKYDVSVVFPRFVEMLKEVAAFSGT